MIIPFLFRFAAQCSFCVILIHQGYSWGYKRKENTINGVNITQYTHKLLYKSYRTNTNFASWQILWVQTSVLHIGMRRRIFCLRYDIDRYLTFLCQTYCVIRGISKASPFADKALCKNWSILCCGFYYFVRMKYHFIEFYIGIYSVTW